jgi:hypothetical protein
MKRLLLIFILLITALQGFSQTAGISYQAVILNPNAQELPGVDAQGNILANSAVSIQFTIVDASGSEEFQEYHTTSTDRYGMINLLIGNGTATSSNDFTDITWGGSIKKLKVGIDFSGGSNFSPLSEQNLSYMPQPPTQKTTDLILDNTDLISTETTTARAAEAANTAAIVAEAITARTAEQANATGITTNATGISTLESEQATQNAAIALNTSKIGITTAQASTISNTTGINTEDQDISGILVNETAVSTLETEQTTQNTAIALNTSKIGITPAQATTIINTTGVNKGDQDISGIATNATAISVIETDQITQNSAIGLNTAKEGITPAQATAISNTTGVNTGDQDISGILVNETAVSTLKTEQTTQNTAIALNTSKIGITTDQATAISTNTSNIATNVTDILTNASDIATYSTDIANIASNVTAISTNTTAIATNGTAISTNASGIATNVTDIALKANIVSPTLTGTPLAPTATKGDSSTAIATTAFVTNAVSTATSGSFVDLTTDQTIAGSKTFSDNTSVGGTLDVTGDTSVNTFDSSGATSLATGGGVVNVASSGVMTTVIGTLNVAEGVNLNSTENSTSSTTGALVVHGGVGINKNAYVGGNLDVTGTTLLRWNTSIDGDLNVAEGVNLNSTENSTSSTTGALVVHGGVGIAENLNVGGNFEVTGTTSFTGAQAITDTTESVSTTTGALTVAGGVGINKNAYVGGNLDVNGTTILQGNTSIDGDLNVAE